MSLYREKDCFPRGLKLNLRETTLVSMVNRKVPTAFHFDDETKELILKSDELSCYQ